MNPNNRRIAQNTLMLYFRMMLIMGVTLYTSRVVLEVLGVQDFGIYNVVGGVVVMFGFLNSAMSTATQRFFSFELGRKNFDQLRKLFSLAVTVHVLIALVILLLAETVGLWFLNHKLTIPPERMEAANWVYQFSIFTFMVNVMSVPYNAAILSHERMKVFAYVSVVEVLLKLAIVFALQWFGFDKLMLYAILVFGVSLTIRLIYQLYCTRQFTECRYHFVWDRLLFKELTGFVGWNFLGRMAVIGRDQGGSFVLNSFFGVLVNAALGVATQLSAGIYTFVMNFQSAFQPQLVKSYAEGNLAAMFQLINRSSKLSFFLFFPITLMMWTNGEYLMRFWLGNVPEYAVLFVDILLIDLLISSISAPFWMSIFGIGKIRTFQIVDGSLMLLNLPLTYALIANDFPPQVYLYVRICITTCTFMYSIYYLRKSVGFPVGEYMKGVIARLATIGIPIAIVLPWLIGDTAQFTRLLLTGSLLALSIPPLYFFVGLTKEEQQTARRMITAGVKRLRG